MLCGRRGQYSGRNAKGRVAKRKFGGTQKPPPGMTGGWSIGFVFVFWWAITATSSSSSFSYHLPVHRNSKRHTAVRRMLSPSRLFQSFFPSFSGSWLAAHAKKRPVSGPSLLLFAGGLGDSSLNRAVPHTAGCGMLRYTVRRRRRQCRRSIPPGMPSPRRRGRTRTGRTSDCLSWPRFARTPPGW